MAVIAIIVVLQPYPFYFCSLMLFLQKNFTFETEVSEEELFLFLLSYTCVYTAVLECQLLNSSP